MAVNRYFIVGTRNPSLFGTIDFLQSLCKKRREEMTMGCNCENETKAVLPLCRRMMIGNASLFYRPSSNALYALHNTHQDSQL
jgi:hypothetical protein